MTLSKVLTLVGAWAVVVFGIMIIVIAVHFLGHVTLTTTFIQLGLGAVIVMLGFMARSDAYCPCGKTYPHFHSLEEKVADPRLQHRATR